MNNEPSKSELAPWYSRLLQAAILHPWVTRFAGIINQTLHFPKDILVQIHGFKMYANTLDRLFALLLWKWKALERFESTIIGQYLTEGMYAVDIGANIGYHTLQLAKIVGASGRIYAFEPDPNNFRLLCKNINANNFTNVVAICKAVGMASGKANLYHSKGHTGDHRLFDSKDGRDSIEVEATTIDDYFHLGPALHLIKMDVQGGEYNALAGMTATIKRDSPCLFMEYTPYLLRKSGVTPKELLDKITELGLRIRYINESKKRLETVSPEELQNFFHGKGHQYINLCLDRETGNPS